MTVYMPKEVHYRFRQRRGMELASSRTIRKKGELWIVPSQAGSGYYLVDLRPDQATCTCEDYRKNQWNCKHIFAAFYRQLRERS